jgi:hypothetical protein
LLAFSICCSLVVATTIMHYEFLRALSSLLPKLPWPGRSRAAVLVLGTFCAHLLEICLYGAAYFLLKDHFGLGGFGGHFAGRISTFLYFSAETYTSLGFGDIFPTGDLRMVCGIEALNGLLLIGWSASFAYVVMERIWYLGNERGAEDRADELSSNRRRAP